MEKIKAKIEEYSKYTKSGSRLKKEIRYKVAEEQFQKAPESVEKIKEYIKEFLELIGMEGNCKHEVEIEKIKNDKKYYSKIKEEYGLTHYRHLVWLKFTKSGHLGVVAAGADINFYLPTKNIKKRNTSGELVHHIGQEWNEEFVLIYPLPNLPYKLRDFKMRGRIECGIGNYLLEKGVPIIDQESHKF